MTSECDQCCKITEVKNYIWKYKGEEGYLDLCSDCVEDLKYEGYVIKEAT